MSDDPSNTDGDCRPNGSGKSTFTAALGLELSMLVVDPDAIFDNSSDQGPRQVLDLGRITARAQAMPVWVTTHLSTILGTQDRVDDP